MKPLVSICCITYNHEKFIRNCIDGFLMQETNFAVEILIFDDASTDNTQEIIKDYAARNANIITFLQIENQWKYRKYGLTDWLFPSAKGKYIALCEGDDYWTDPLKLQKQVDFLEANHTTSVVVHAARIYLENRQIFKGVVNPYPEDYFVEISDVVMRGGGLFATNSMVFRRQFIIDLPEFFGHYSFGDYSLMIYLAMRGDVYYFNSPMSVYRQGVKESWTDLNKGKDKAIQHQLELISMLENFKHLQFKDIGGLLDMRIRKIKFNIALINNDFKELNKIEYKGYYSDFKNKLSLFSLLKHNLNRLISKL